MSASTQNRDTRLVVKVPKELKADLAGCCHDLKQSESNVVNMLIDAFVTSMKEQGCVAIPIQLRDPSEVQKAQSSTVITAAGNVAIDSHQSNGSFRVFHVCSIFISDGNFPLHRYLRAVFGSRTAFNAALINFPVF